MVDIHEGNKEEPTESSVSILSNYMMKAKNRMRVPGTIKNYSYIAKQYNLVLVRGEGEVLSLYDTSAAGTSLDQFEFNNPLLSLEGHSSSGFGLDWNPSKEAIALSSDSNGTICIWDISQASKLESKIHPSSKFSLGYGGIYVISK